MTEREFIPTLDETPIDTAARRLESMDRDFLSWAKNEQYGIMDRAIRGLILDLTIVLFYIKGKEKLGNKNDPPKCGVCGQSKDNHDDEKCPPSRSSKE